jgi:hypothetical protein
LDFRLTVQVAKSEFFKVSIYFLEFLTYGQGLANIGGIFFQGAPEKKIADLEKKGIKKRS